MDIEKIASVIVDSVFKVHKTLGPGLLDQPIKPALLMNLLKGD
jgi:hypothetical protein